MKIEQIKTGELIPYARNARTHNDIQIIQIAGSIKEFGFTNPVLIDADNGIIAGHGRVMAAQRLKLNEIPCIRLAHLTDTQRRAYILADNKLALNSGWDEELLNLELESLRDMNFDLSLIGFMDNEFNENEEIENESNEVKIKSTFEVIAECNDEDHQRMVYNILNEKGIKCRLATL